MAELAGLSPNIGNIPFRIAEEDKIDLTDLCILKKLLEGKSLKETADELGIVEKTVSNRLTAMEKRPNPIIIKRQAPVIDILQLYNFILISYVKLHLAAAIPEVATRPPPLPGATTQSTPSPPSWFEVLRDVKNIDPKLFDKLVRFAFIPLGTDYDLVLIMSVQSIEELARFFAQLQSKGFIDRVLSHLVIPSAGYHFDPVAVPDPDEVAKGIKQMQKFQTKIKEVAP